jgi:hypothetical protein
VLTKQKNMNTLLKNEFSLWAPEILAEEFGIKIPSRTKPSTKEMDIVASSKLYTAMQKDFEGEMYAILVKDGQILDIAVDGKCCFDEFDDLTQIKDFFGL